MSGAEAEPLLRVDGLTIGYPSGAGHVRAVDGVSFDVEPGERVGIVGESGSGKTTLALALMRLLPPWAAHLGGEVFLDGVDLHELRRGGLRRLRGGQVGMVFQDPLRSFDPLRTIGFHLDEGMRAQGIRSRSEMRRRAVATLRSVGMPTPESQLRRRPHELSGGMQQRSLIALGVQNDPRLLIADEPTTALDVTIQAQILELFETVGEPGPWQDTALLLVSHNLGLVRRLCTRVMVMYGGRLVEDAPVDDFFRAPRHPYGAALLGAMPRLSGPRGAVTTIPGHPVDISMMPAGCPFEPRCAFALPRCATDMPDFARLGPDHFAACFVAQEGPPPDLDASASEGADDLESAAAVDSAGEPVVELTEVSKVFRVRTAHARGRRGLLHALAGVDLDLRAGETLALVGESGSGKSTLARLVLGLSEPTSGRVRVEGDDPAARRSDVRKRQRVQAVFQDPHGSLDPRMRVADVVGEPLRNLGISRSGRRSAVGAALEEVRLAGFEDRYPHELSGGQAQRVAIARAIAADPAIIVLDEPTASLDVSIQTHIVSLLRDLQRQHGLTYLFVSHDLAAVREIATRVAVMYLGRIVELTDADDFFERPLHPYAAALLSAVPRAEAELSGRERIVLNGEPPSAVEIPLGCPFHPRCPVAEDLCRKTPPPLAEVEPKRFAACHFPGRLDVVHGVRRVRPEPTPSALLS